MAIVVEGLLTMPDIVFLVCQVGWFDVLGEECCNGVIKSVIGLIELGADQVPIISGSPVQALSKVSEFVWALGQQKSCDMANVSELKDAAADGFNVISFQQWH